MPASSSQPWSRLIRPGYNDQIRVSDAERSEVADRLATHYSDGRLDKAEFDERVSRAMSAKTRADLNGLFDDLPDVGAGHADDTVTGSGGRGGAAGSGGMFGPTRPYGMSRRQRGRAHPVLAVAVLIVMAVIAWHVLAHVFFFIPWFAIMVLIAAVAFANRASRRPRRDR